MSYLEDFFNKAEALLAQRAGVLLFAPLLDTGEAITMFAFQDALFLLDVRQTNCTMLIFCR